MGDDFKAYSEERRQKRRQNTEYSTEYLRELGVPFEVCNHGAHLIVAGIVDFYPSTGLFIPRDRSYGKDRGLHRMLKFLRARALDAKRRETSCNKV